MPDPTAEAVRAYCAARRFSDPTLERWLRLAASDAAALVDLARELRLGENQLRDLWDWADDIAARDGVTLAQVVTAGAVQAARRGHVGRNDKLKLIKAALRRLRFPELSTLEERLADLIRQLALPPTVRVTLPDFLEGSDVHVEIIANSAGALLAAVGRLQEAAQSPACAAIFSLLGEAP
jgi:hypothetical protein